VLGYVDDDSTEKNVIAQGFLKVAVTFTFLQTLSVLIQSIQNATFVESNMLIKCDPSHISHVLHAMSSSVKKAMLDLKLFPPPSLTKSYNCCIIMSNLEAIASLIQAWRRNRYNDILLENMLVRSCFYCFRDVL